MVDTTWRFQCQSVTETHTLLTSIHGSAFRLMIQEQNFAVWRFGGSNDGVFRLMVVKSHFLDRNIAYTEIETS